jgi:hypothetical protein
MEHDLAPFTIDMPAAGTVPPSIPFNPAATFQNLGLYPESRFFVKALIVDGLGQTVYADSVFLFAQDSLWPESLASAVCPAHFTPQPSSSYLMFAVACLPGDENPANDTMSLAFTTFEDSASLWGNIYDDNQGGAAPLSGVLVIAASGQSSFQDTTDAAGAFSFYNLPPDSYTVVASKAGYRDSSLSMAILPGSHVSIDIGLGYPVPAFIPSDSLVVVLPPNTVDSTRFILLDNAGARTLFYEIFWPDQRGKGFGDSLWGIDLEAATGDGLCLGVEFAFGSFWVTGAGPSPGSDPNYLYRLDRQGQLLSSFVQPTENGFGWRDLCCDGQYLYASSDSAIIQIDPTDGQPTGLEIAGPTSPCRGLAYDPETDHFYVANFNQPIREIDRQGNIVNSWSHSYDIFGLAWDPSPDGPWLWTTSTGPSGSLLANRFDPRLGVFSGGFVRPSIDSANATAGGAAFTADLVPGRGSLVCLIQDMPDRLLACELRPDNASWLALEHSAGALPPGGRDSINLLFDNCGLDSTLDYSAKVFLYSTNPTRIESLAVIMRTATGVAASPDPVSVYRQDALLPCRPNPARTSLCIPFHIFRQNRVSLKIYNASGRLVKVLLDVILPSGPGSIMWDGTDDRGRRLPSGVYIIRLVSPTLQTSQKVLLLR